MQLRVASLLGCTLAELEPRMGAGEWPLWCAFYALEPWGFVQQDHHYSGLCATVANFAGRSLKEGKSMAPADFASRRANAKTAQPEPVELTPEQTDRYLDLMFR